MCNGLLGSSTPFKMSHGFSLFFPWWEFELFDELHVLKYDSCINELPRFSCCAASQGSDSESKIFSKFSELPCSCWKGRAMDGVVLPFPLRPSIFCKWVVLCLGMNLLQKGKAILFQWKYYLEFTLYFSIRTWQWCIELRKNRAITKILEKERKVAAIKRKFKSLKLDQIAF